MSKKGQSGVHVLYVSGAGHSGSTLLDILLSGHPQIVGLGEFHRLSLYARTNDDLCTCGQPVVQCPFWLDAERRLPEAKDGFEPGSLMRSKEVMLRPQSLSRVADVGQRALMTLNQLAMYRLAAPRLFAEHHLAIQNSLDWYEAVRSATGAQVVVDSSKDARRMMALVAEAPESVRVIHMIRDGRAVAASEMRRTDVGMHTAAKNWVSSQRSAWWPSRFMRKGTALRVRYEDLCRSPEPVVAQILRFLGLPEHDMKVGLQKDTVHNIAGNPMRKRKGETTIRLDEQWRTSLSSADLAEFERVAGGWNRRFGYLD